MRKTNSIRPFIGARDFETSREFYTAWGFSELRTSDNLSYFSNTNIGFYLQDYFVKEWVDNTMLFLEVSDLQNYWKELKALKIAEKFGAKLIEPKSFDWGEEGFLYDPSGILWHIGSFHK